MNLWKWLLTLGALAALVVAGTQWQTLHRLRLENETLRAAGGAAEVPPVDPEQLRQQDDELARGRETTRALARVRNEIRQWRGQKSELDQLRAANQKLVAARQAGTNAPGAGYVTGAALKDAGLASPEDACQTVFFALRNGDMRRMLECLAPDSRDRAGITSRPEAEIAQTGEQVRQQFQKFPGYLVLEKRETPDSEVEISLQSTPGGAMMKLPFRRYGSEWKLLRFP